MSAAEIVHACPRGDSGITTCCQRTPFELPWTDRMTLDPNLVTCHRTSQGVGGPAARTESTASHPAAPRDTETETR